MQIGLQMSPESGSAMCEGKHVRGMEICREKEMR